MSLSGVVCVVTGASRGIGKGVALQLGEAGAIVYITAKHLTGDDEDPTGASLTDVATEVRLRGGHCIPVQCDHAKDADVKALFDQVTKEQKGQLDILVNNAFDGIMTMADNLGKPFWEQPIKLWDEIMDVGLRNNYICSVHAAKLMVQRKKGLIINISSSGGLRYALNVPYGVSKEACDRMATDCAKELSRFNVAMVSLWPGHVLTEILEWLMDHDRWNLKIQNNGKSLKDIFRAGESAEFVGKSVLHLYKDKDLQSKSGKILLTSDLGIEYSFKDIDGRAIPSMRQLNTVKTSSGILNGAFRYFPDFFRLPKWMYCLLGNKF